ncbi:diadenosine hexaphosphate hydrolase (ATP-forming) [Kroppenstedtia sanguinis]|uniref:NUDIX hydrolase n=1 Tax=Kroppenstedtia sanguinis TaxID=1380684 RepID=A0ABW4C7K9_9BACL
MKEISAGGVVYKQEGGEIFILMIKDRYSTWSLPKGKRESGETNEQTALREILEETGVEGEIEQPLETIFYRYFHPDYGEVEKEVHYFLVQARAGKTVPQLSEITDVAWLSPQQAWEKQQTKGYENNLSVVRKAFACLGIQVHPVEGDSK